MILTLTLIGSSDNSYQYGWATFPSKAMTGHLKVRFFPKMRKISSKTVFFLVKILGEDFLEIFNHGLTLIWHLLYNVYESYLGTISWDQES